MQTDCSKTLNNFRLPGRLKMCDTASPSSIAGACGILTNLDANDFEKNIRFFCLSLRTEVWSLKFSFGGRNGGSSNCVTLEPETLA